MQEKNMKKVLFILMLCAGILAGCANTSGGGGDGGSSSKSIKICLIGADTAKTWNVWAWKENGDNDVNYSSKSWPGGDIQLANTDSTNGYIYTTMSVDMSYPLGILFVDSTASSQTGNITVPVSVLTGTSALYFIYGSTDYYTSFDDIAGIKSAEITSTDGNTITAVIYGVSSISSADFSVSNSAKTKLAVSAVSLSDTTATISVSGGNVDSSPYSVMYNDTTVSAAVSSDLIDSIMVYSGSDLGATFSAISAVTFKTWTPLASSVTLLLYSDASAVSSDTISTTETMIHGEKGVWSVTTDCSSYKYYKYRIVNSGTTYDVCDIWAKACSPDSVASQITDIDDGTTAVPGSSSETYDGTASSYINPWTGSNYTEAIIYEMHIRDWSQAVVTDSTGKYLDLADSNTFMDHLKDLGITHVQIMPMFDYAQKNSDTTYNWGYNPYQYNVPEGRYVNDMTDGTDAVVQLRTLIQRLHDNGIAVNMDVVYNHTSGTGSDSLYDMTVPKYFYRMSGTSYSNGSGCGNEIATNHAMVEKYVIDSLKHWMLDYHINGFRFDLMGCAETSTMKDIYEALSAIDPDVMVYGEPWTGGTSAVSDGVTKSTIDSCSSSTSVNGVACFNDDFRNAIKGAEYGGFKKGQVQGTYDDDAVLLGLYGSPKAQQGFTGRIGRSINYCECHDNYTLFDKLAISYLNKTSYSGDLFTKIGTTGLAAVKKQDKLAAAYVFLAQGTPFINGGQEFLRTKQGDDNSYESSDTINRIDLSMKNTYSDVYNTYKALIALRKSYKAFTSATSSSASTLADGVTKYITAGSDGTFTILFNATGSDYMPSSAVVGYPVTLSESDGSISVATETTGTSVVPAKEFVIIKTK
jgi:pullulanase